MNERRRRVELAPAAVRQLRRLPPNEAARLRAPILSLGLDPFSAGAARLVGTSFWHLRIGDLRVICAIDEEARAAVVLRVARRAESTYRRIG